MKKKIKIKDFLILQRPEKVQDSYIIKQINNKNCQNLEILKLIKEILENYPNLTAKQKIAYCKGQRDIMKLYFRNIHEEKKKREL